MSRWRWFRRVRSTESPQAEARPEPPAVHGEAEARPDPLAVLEDPARSESDKLALFAEIRGTALERPLLERLVRAAAEHDLGAVLSARAAELLFERGERQTAEWLLQRSPGPHAELVWAEAAHRRGEVALALRHLERVLARDVTWPSVLERHRQWSLALRASSRPPDHAPTLLDHERHEPGLRVVCEAGRGGTATVYEAFDEHLQRTVALKVYHRPKADAEKLLREARLAVKLAGTGLVPVFDVDPERGYLVLEYLSAGSLEAAITRRDSAVLWPIERWLEPLAAAVARLHRAGIVHADLKPANVLFRSPDEPLLADLGNAVTIGSVWPWGTPGYVSPERAAGAAATASDDVFGLGRTLEGVLAALRPTRPSAALAAWEALARLATAAEHARPSSVRDWLSRVER